MTNNATEWIWNPDKTLAVKEYLRGQGRIWREQAGKKTWSAALRPKWRLPNPKSNDLGSFASFEIAVKAVDKAHTDT